MELKGRASAMSSLPIIPFILATALSLHGLRKRSLSPSGSIAAFIVGFLIMSTQLRAFGVSLIVFYLIGSRATKVGKGTKQKLEEGGEESGGGYRTGTQVLCNSLTALVAAVAWSAMFTSSSLPARVLSPYFPSSFRPYPEYSPTTWCAVSPDRASILSRSLIFLALGHFACCLGDTLASELGILSKTPPRLITTLRTVPPGTNGGLSTMGTAASLLGGAIIGATYAVSLAIENPACRTWSLAMLVPWGTMAGGLGSLIDSFLGATLQKTMYNTTSKRILTDEAKVVIKMGKPPKVISGIDFLTNNQVNLISSAMTGLFMAWVTTR